MSSSKKFISKFVNLAIYDDLSEQNKEHVRKAEEGNGDSIFYLINSFLYGQNGFPKSKLAGIKYLNYGTEQNIVSVIELHGNLLLKGDILPKDEEKAITLLNKAATIQQNPQKKLSLVHLLLSKQSYDINSTANANINYFLAKQICKEAADFGDANSMREYAIISMMHQNNKYGEIKANFSETFKYFTLSSEKGDCESMCHLGNFYEFGSCNVEIDKEKSFELYKKSYEKGSLNGCAFYGYKIFMRKQNPDDEKEGLKLIKYSCERNSPCGLNVYGFLINYGLLNNNISERDFEKAFRYYKKSANLGFFTAINNIGTYYRDGIVVQKDFNLAIKYFELAESLGSIGGVNNLCRIYSEQNYSINNFSKARFYFKISIDNGSREIISEYCSFLLKILQDEDTDDETFENDQIELVKMLDYGHKIKDVKTMRLKAALLLDGCFTYEMNCSLAVEILNECAGLGSVEAIENLIEIFEDGYAQINPDENQANIYKKMLEEIKDE